MKYVGEYVVALIQERGYFSYGICFWSQKDNEYKSMTRGILHPDIEKAKERGKIVAKAEEIPFMEEIIK